MNLAERLLYFSIAVLCVVGAFTNKIFYWGRMGGGHGPHMPRWLAIAFLLAGAALFI
jgi:hypothetical protein